MKGTTGNSSNSVQDWVDVHNLDKRFSDSAVFVWNGFIHKAI